MWSLASSPCSGVYTPIWAGYQGGTPAEWQRGSGSYTPDSAWWAFESIQRLLAPPDNSNKEFWESHWPAIRNRWAATEARRESEIAALEGNVSRLLQQGSPEEARRLLTNYSNVELHADFMGASSILDSLKTQK